jgi:hypothetical protein
MATTHQTRNQDVAGLANPSQLGALTLEILDEAEDETVQLERLGRRRQYQLRLLASFLESAHRGSLEDLSALVEAHRRSVTASATPDRPVTRPPNLDDDYSSWDIVQENTPNRKEARALVNKGPQVIDSIVEGQREFLRKAFTRKVLIPFLDRLAHADERAAMQPVEGWHSLRT